MTRRVPRPGRHNAPQIEGAGEVRRDSRAPRSVEPNADPKQEHGESLFLVRAPGPGRRDAAGIGKSRRAELAGYTGVRREPAVERTRRRWQNGRFVRPEEGRRARPTSRARRPARPAPRRHRGQDVDALGNRWLEHFVSIGPGGWSSPERPWGQLIEPPGEPDAARTRRHVDGDPPAPRNLHRRDVDDAATRVDDRGGDRGMRCTRHMVHVITTTGYSSDRRLDDRSGGVLIPALFTRARWNASKRRPRRRAPPASRTRTARRGGGRSRRHRYWGDRATACRRCRRRPPARHDPRGA